MAKLYINKDIGADRDKLHYWLSGDNCISFSDIQGFLSYVKPEDNNIDIELHSCGGDCVEGYAIYDALRSCGKQISCKVVGICASMATVILLAAPKDRRSMYEHAQILIHSPYYAKGSVNDNLTMKRLDELKDGLVESHNKMLSLYVERTGVGKEEIEKQMKAGDLFGVDRAIELGFVSSKVPATSAKIDNQIKNEKMEKEEKPTVAEAFRMLGVALGLSKPQELAKKITSATGDVFTVKRESGEIKVGDEASPDGSYTLEDGRKVVVKDGTITEIKEPSKKKEEKANEEVERLNAQIETLGLQIAELEKQKKTEEEVRIIESVKAAGGEDWLKRVAKSTYSPTGRWTEVKTDGQEGKSIIEQRLAAFREKQMKKYTNTK